MKSTACLLLILLLLACNKKVAVERTTNFPRTTEFVQEVPDKENVWVFILAGQSNMAGRGTVEPQDTIVNDRILTVNSDNKLILAKEPLHWYEPDRAGLDCGYSFGKTMVKSLPSKISILLIPAAVGGSSISQWIGDSLYRNVKLLSNFTSKVEWAKKYGVIKGVLWHQGESDANDRDIPNYKERLQKLFAKFRAIASNDQLPVILGELGSFSTDKPRFTVINEIIHNYSLTDKNSAVISTGNLKDRGDRLHFNSKSQRRLGKRYAEVYLKKFR